MVLNARCLRLATGPLVAAALVAAGVARADTVTVSADTQTAPVRDEHHEADSHHAQAGGLPTIKVRSTHEGHGEGSRAFLRFDLSSLPEGATIDKAVLRLWADDVHRAGAVDVLPVLVAWEEKTLTEDDAPATAAPVASFGIARKDERHFVSVEITDLVRNWLSGAQANNGVALVGSEDHAVDVEFDSKENEATSHAPEVEVALAGTGSGGGGSQGPPGAAATVQVGSTTTVPAGTPASVVNSGTTSAAVFDFAIPQGPMGLAGPGFLFRGAFDPSASYAVDDIVTDQGSSYVAVAPSSGPNNPAPGTNPGTWSAMAQKGAPGPGFLFRGPFDATSPSYAIDDVVTDQGSSYVAIQAWATGDPGPNGSGGNLFWSLMARKGDPGAAGGVVSVTALSPLASSGGANPEITLAGIIPISGGGTGNGSGIASGFSGNLAGDVTGTQSATVVSRLQGLPLSIGVPAAGNVLQWTGAAWAPAPVSVGATPLNVPGAIVSRDGTGNFAAGSISLSGNLAFTGLTGLMTIGGARFLHNYGINNTFVGANAGNMTMTGGANAAFGFGALFSNTTGGLNAAFGAYALSANTSGLFNSAFGDHALFYNTTGGNNSAFGNRALFSNTTGASNAAFGSGALNFNTTGASNAAFGVSALTSNTTGASNAAFGAAALAFNTTGYTNNAFGATALQSNTTGYNNDAFGYAALSANTTGYGNQAFGWHTLGANTTGTGNAAFGYSALRSNTTGGGNAAFGFAALGANTTGIFNSAFGPSALYHNTTGNGNNAFGGNALESNTIGANNDAFGANALYSNTTGANNDAFGESALKANTTGQANSAFGYTALTANTTGVGNAAFGYHALLQNTTGVDNIAMGIQTLASNTTGSYNTALGTSALGLSTGSGNVALGYSAGVNLTSGGNNIYIGNFGATSESNTIRIGSNQTATYVAGVAGQTSGSGFAVFMNSSGKLGTNTSSARFKDDIVGMGGESDVLMKLRPVAFYYKPELDETHTRQYGLVAEEVADLAPGLVIYDEHGAPQTVRYHFVNAMLLDVVQKQQRIIMDLSARLDRLEAALDGRPPGERSSTLAVVGRQSADGELTR